MKGSGWLVSATCVPWYVPRGNTGLSKLGDPVLPHCCLLNQSLARVRTWGVVPARCAPIGATNLLSSHFLHLCWTPVNRPWGVAPGGQGGGRSFYWSVTLFSSRRNRSDGCRLAVVFDVPLRSVVLQVGGLSTGISMSLW